MDRVHILAHDTVCFAVHNRYFTFYLSVLTIVYQTFIILGSKPNQNIELKQPFLYCFSGNQLEAFGPACLFTSAASKINRHIT